MSHKLAQCIQVNEDIQLCLLEERHACTSQDAVGEFGTLRWVDKRSEMTGFRQGTARRMIRISPTASWDGPFPVTREVISHHLREHLTRISTAAN
jgi:hypothetical protein